MSNVSFGEAISAGKSLRSINSVMAEIGEQKIELHDFICDCKKKSDSEPALVKESVESKGMTGFEAEVKFREFWGL